jgi:hypothetical protein
MALRIARGLFRLWLVSSVLWVCIVGGLTWWRLPTQEVIIWDPFDPPKGSGFDPDKWLREKDKEEAERVAQERRTALTFAGGLAFAPPAFLLVLGWALVWAVRGFR